MAHARRTLAPDRESRTGGQEGSPSDWWNCDPLFFEVGDVVTHHTRGRGAITSINPGSDRRIHVLYQDGSLHNYSERSWRSGKLSRSMTRTKTRRESLTPSAKGIIGAAAQREGAAALRRGGEVLAEVKALQPPPPPSGGYRGLDAARACLNLQPGHATKLSTAVIQASDALDSAQTLGRDTFVAIVCSTIWPMEVKGSLFEERVHYLRALYKSCEGVDKSDAGVDGESLAIICARLAPASLAAEASDIAVRLFDADKSGGITLDELGAYLTAHSFIDNAVRDDVTALSIKDDAKVVHREAASWAEWLMKQLKETGTVLEDGREYIPNARFGAWLATTWRPSAVVALEEAPPMPGFKNAKATLGFKVGAMASLQTGLLDTESNVGALPPHVFVEVVSAALWGVSPANDAQKAILLALFHTMDELHVGTVDSSFLASALATFAHGDDVEGACALLTAVYHYDMEGESGGLAVDDINEYLHCCLTVENAMRAPGVARLSLDEIEATVERESRAVFARLSSDQGGGDRAMISVEAFQGYIRAQVGVEHHPGGGDVSDARSTVGSTVHTARPYLGHAPHSAAPSSAAAAAPSAPSAACVWMTYWSDEHASTYWSNRETGETTWNVPPELAPWHTHVSDTGDAYYINTVTHETSWEIPTGWGQGNARPPPLPVAIPEPHDAAAGYGIAVVGDESARDARGGGWTPHWSERDGSYYYVNDLTQETSWSRPAGMTALA